MNHKMTNFTIEIVHIKPETVKVNCSIRRSNDAIKATIIGTRVTNETQGEGGEPHTKFYTFQVFDRFSPN